MGAWLGLLNGAACSGICPSRATTLLAALLQRVEVDSTGLRAVASAVLLPAWPIACWLPILPALPTGAPCKAVRCPSVACTLCATAWKLPVCKCALVAFSSASGRAAEPVGNTDCRLRADCSCPCAESVTPSAVSSRCTRRVLKLLDDIRHVYPASFIPE